MKNMIVSIRQPGYLPNIGLFQKLMASDTFVFFDDAQYAIRAWDNRNKIRNKDYSMWLSVPVIKPFKKLLKEVEIDGDAWKSKHKMAIKSSYQETPFFKKYWNDIELIFSKRWNKLIDLNITLIEHFMEILDIHTKTIKSSELDVPGTSSQKLFNICQKLKATTYLSGKMGKEYLDEDYFSNAKIDVIYDNFPHPTYSQIYDVFIPNMSILDLLFNKGDESKSIVLNSIESINS